MNAITISLFTYKYHFYYCHLPLFLFGSGSHHFVQPLESTIVKHIILLLLYFVVAPLKCPCNEVYSECKDPCPVTCNAITTGEPGPDCVRPNPCKGGCNCADGYVRNHCNKCVLENDCRKWKLPYSLNKTPFNWWILYYVPNELLILD